MPGPSGESCVECYFFVPLHARKEDESIESCAKRAEELEGFAGFCCRFPPLHDPGNTDHFDECGAVACFQWCGEFKSIATKMDAPYSQHAPLPSDIPDDPAQWPFSVRTCNCLTREGIRSWRQLCACSEAELLEIKNFGSLSLSEVQSALSERGWNLFGRRPQYDERILRVGDRPYR
jgi:hypothetical protein